MNGKGLAVCRRVADACCACKWSVGLHLRLGFMKSVKAFASTLHSDSVNYNIPEKIAKYPLNMQKIKPIYLLNATLALFVIQNSPQRLQDVKNMIFTSKAELGIVGLKSGGLISKRSHQCRCPGFSPAH